MRKPAAAAILCTLLLFPAPSAVSRGAEAPVILGCRTDTPGWKAQLDLRDDASASLSVERSGGKKHRCRLTLNHFTDRPNAVVAMMEFQFTRAACVPALPAEDEKTLHAEIPLIFKWGSPRKAPTGSVQWLRTSQVTPCRLTAFKGEELRRNAEKWLLGTWGPPEPSEAPSVQ